MDKIKFLYKDYYDIMDEYGDDLYGDTSTVVQGKDDLEIFGFRFDIPELNVSIREANWFAYTDGEWVTQDSVYVLYDEGETDLKAYAGFITQSPYYMLVDVCKQKKFDVENIDNLECYLVHEECVHEEE